MSINTHKKSDFSKNDIEEKSFSVKENSTLDAQTLYKILIKKPHLINSVDDKKESILSYSIKNHNISVANLILTSPILDLDYQDANGNSYLHLAILYKQEEIVKSLIEKGININKKNKEGNTALHLAYLKNYKEIINILEENGIDTNIRNNNNKLAEEMNFNFKPNTSRCKTSSNLSNKEVNKTQVKSDKNFSNNINNNNNNDSNNISIKTKNNKTINSYNFKPKQNIATKQNNNINNRSNHTSHLINVCLTSNIRKPETNNNTRKQSNNNDPIYISEEIMNIEFYKNSIKKYNKKYPEIEKKIKNDCDFEKKSIDEDKLCIINPEEKENSYTEETKNNKTKSDVNKIFSSNINTNRTSPKALKRKKMVKNKNRNSNKNNNFVSSIGLNDEDKNMFMSQYEQNLQKNSSLKKIETKMDNSASAKNIHKSKINNMIQNDDNSRDTELEDIQNLYKNNNINEKPNVILYNKMHNQNKKALTTRSTLKRNNILNTNNAIKDNTIKTKSTYVLSSLVNQNKKIVEKKNNNLLVEFLSQINLLKYYYNMDSNGFDDINILIEEAKKGALIKDQELKEAGIKIPGDRAKILIRIKEKANIFGFSLPKGVYHICKDLNNIEDDNFILKLNNWLKTIKVEDYLMNFINSGYHSLELLLIQMDTESPLTQEILRDEIGIKIIGHRSRILNKLREDGRNLNNKLKTTTIIVNNKGDDKNCECIIF